jgi:hypothetical protein
MDAVSTFLRILLMLCLAALAAGMVRPDWVLWFIAVKHRWAVIRYYGTAAAGLWLALKLINRLIP